jgi:hypothetical protein
MFPAWDMGSGDQAVFQYKNGDMADFEDLQVFTGGYLINSFTSATEYAIMVDDTMTFRHRVTSDYVELAYNWGYYFQGMDFYGMKDTGAPVTTASIQGTFDETYGYYTSEIGVTLTATDDVTGVMTTYYTIDGGSPQVYTRPFVIEGDGTHSFCFWSEDYEGNVEEQKCVENLVIDETGPSVTITGPEPGIYLMGNKILNSDKYIFLFGGVTVSASVSIDGAPLQTVEFYMNDELFAEDTSSPFQMTCTLKNSGSATFKVVARDVLGEDDEDSLTVDTYLKIF